MGDTPREYLAEQLAADQTDWDVRDWPCIPARLGKGEVMVSVWRDTVDPAPTVLGLEHKLTLHVYGAKATASKATEDEQDNIFDKVMLSIERLNGCTFKRGTRRTFADDAFTGWEIEATFTSPNHYRKAVQQERSNP